MKFFGSLALVLALCSLVCADEKRFEVVKLKHGVASEIAFLLDPTNEPQSRFLQLRDSDGTQFLLEINHNLQNSLPAKVEVIGIDSQKVLLLNAATPEELERVQNLIKTLDEKPAWMEMQVRLFQVQPKKLSKFLGRNFDSQNWQTHLVESWEPLELMRPPEKPVNTTLIPGYPVQTLTLSGSLGTTVSVAEASNKVVILKNWQGSSEAPVPEGVISYAEPRKLLKLEFEPSSQGFLKINISKQPFVPLFPGLQKVQNPQKDAVPEAAPVVSSAVEIAAGKTLLVRLTNSKAEENSGVVWVLALTPQFHQANPDSAAERAVVR